MMLTAAIQRTEIIVTQPYTTYSTINIIPINCLLNISQNKKRGVKMSRFSAPIQHGHQETTPSLPLDLRILSRSAFHP